MKFWPVFVNCVLFNKEKEFSLINLVRTSTSCNLSNSHYKTVYKTEGVLIEIYDISGGGGNL